MLINTSKNMVTYTFTKLKPWLIFIAQLKNNIKE